MNDVGECHDDSGGGMLEQDVADIRVTEVPSITALVLGQSAYVIRTLRHLPVTCWSRGLVNVDVKNHQPTLESYLSSQPLLGWAVVFYCETTNDDECVITLIASDKAQFIVLIGIGYKVVCCYCILISFMSRSPIENPSLWFVLERAT